MSLSIPLLLALTGGGSAPAFDPLSLEPHLWLDPSDPTTLFQDAAMTTPVTADGDPVGAMLDKSGNGRHLTQSTADSRPLYKTSGSLSWLEFDGVDDVLAVTYGSILEQPYDRVAAWRLLADDSHQILLGFTDVVTGWLGRLGGNFGILNSSGSLVISFTPPSAGVDFVTTDHIDGASSRLAIDNGGYETGDPDALGHGVLQIGNQTNNSSADSNCRFYGLVQFDRALTDAEIALLRTYLAAKQGREL